MSYIYIISIFSLFISALVTEKKDKELDIIKSIGIGLVLLLCYNTFICLFFTLINIPINLISLTIINFLITLICFIKIIKDKKIQKYRIDKKDIIYIIILLVLVSCVSYFNFGFPIRLKYFTNDASIHFMAVKDFFKSDSLLIKPTETRDINVMMPGAYSNAGILFKVFAPIVGEENLYQIFIIFDISLFFLEGLLFFIIIKKYAKTNLQYVLAVIVSAIYIIGYPLNCLLNGFFYLGLGILVISTIFAIMQEYIENLQSRETIVVLFLLCFELFFSYYLFVPPIYGAIFIFYVIYFKRKTGRIINKEIIINTTITLLIPTILGFCYNILPGILLNSQDRVNKLIGMEGYVYRNLFSNIVLFIPFALYYICKNAKNNKFDIIAITIFIAYMFILFIGTFTDYVSGYYFFKNYFVLWLLMLIIFYKGIVEITNDVKYGEYISVIFIVIYLCILEVCLIFNNVQINKDDFNKNEKITDVMDIYGINKTLLFGREKEFTNEQMKIVEYIENNDIALENNNTLIIAEQRQEWWIYAILDYKCKEDLNYYTGYKHVEDWNNGKYKYLVYFKDSFYYEKLHDKLNMDHMVIYQNDSGAILQY